MYNLYCALRELKRVLPKGDESLIMDKQGNKLQIYVAMEKADKKTDSITEYCVNERGIWRINKTGIYSIYSV